MRPFFEKLKIMRKGYKIQINYTKELKIENILKILMKQNWITTRPKVLTKQIKRDAHPRLLTTIRSSIFFFWLRVWAS